MTKKLSWRRLEFAGQTIYIDPDKPDWFVPNKKADQLLQSLLRAVTIPEAVCRLPESRQSNAAAPAVGTIYEMAWLNSLLSTDPTPPYPGRSAYLTIQHLKECWFHLTDACNLACRHCLFSASPRKKKALPRTLLEQGLHQAIELGCNLFYFTGGEPFIYPDFLKIISKLLRDNPAVHVVVLSNGLLLADNINALQNLPADRFHLQVSLDGLEAKHDAIRGHGAFKRLFDNLDVLHTTAISATLAVVVSHANIAELPAIIALAAEQDFKNIHLLWYFVRGNGKAGQRVAPAEILPHILRAQDIAEKAGVLIDNIETLRGQVFTTPGTRHDLSNTAWETVTIGPDGNIYPSPALVNVPALKCGPLSAGLSEVWHHSPVLEKIRRQSLIDADSYRDQPLKFIVGGGDIDHSYLAGGAFVGYDPYIELYNDLALWLITSQANRYPMPPDMTGPAIKLRMGDVRHDCPEDEQQVTMTHCNCVISLANDKIHSTVREFYGQAALRTNDEIINPFAADRHETDYIPRESQTRSYGCGSPVKDAAPQPGEVLVDLGSGSGVECFMAADAVGPHGRVYGIDMTDEMLDLARASQNDVAAKLGYDNVEFQKGYLEDIPLSDKTADAVISNCVINLSPDKRQTFLEIFRILKPGGRLVVSDIVTDLPIPAIIKNNKRFRGECLGGAMQQEELMAMLRSTGFTGMRLLKRFPYRNEGDVAFYSLTFSIAKPAAMQKKAEMVDVIYRGPFGAVYTEKGTLLLKGGRTTISRQETLNLGDSVFLLDKEGAVTNIDMENSCACRQPATQIIVPANVVAHGQTAGGCCAPAGILPQAPTNSQKQTEQPLTVRISVLPPSEDKGHADRFKSGCLACGSELIYNRYEIETHCYYCGTIKKTNVLCAKNHFICDDCHQQKGVHVIKLICTKTMKQDMFTLLKKIRCHPAIAMHGPEHHAMVPGIILATYRNLGGDIPEETIVAGIDRGSKVPGGVCGLWGSCGAATGVGIAYSLLLNATPLTARARQEAQSVTARVLTRISRITGARCCQRETFIALQEAARLSEEMLPVPLLARDNISCNQFENNRECIRKQCPLFMTPGEKA